MKRVITLIFLMILSICGGNVLAEDTQISNGSYSVSAITSEHQSQEIESFFDIRWTPNATDNFGILITNKSDETQTYQLQVNKARTNKNGIIDYSDSTKEQEPIKYKLTQMINIPKEVTISGGQSKKVEGSIKIPGESFNGILMGGIHVSQKKEKEKQSKISNSVAYNLPFIVRGNIDVRPKANLILKSVSLEKFSTTQSSLDIHLSNEEATFLKESDFQAEIKDKSGKTITKQSSKIDITPDTKFVYPIKLPDKIDAGEYQVILEVTHGKDKWEFKKVFQVTNDQSEEIEKRSGIRDYSILIYCIITAIIIILALITINKKVRSNKSTTMSRVNRSKNSK